MKRNNGDEIDVLTTRLAKLEELIRTITGYGPEHLSNHEAPSTVMDVPLQEESATSSAVYFSGYYRSGDHMVRVEPMEKQADELFGLNEAKTAKVLSALGHKQRLDILLELWDRPLTGAELVDRLGMGTTGQLYHHLKALTGADLLLQEERGGRYAIPSHRRFPILLLLSAVSELIDTSTYIDLTEARNEADSYLGPSSPEGHDPHLLLWEIIRNAILEHQAGFCTEISIYMHEDSSVTVADNGRGIPTKLLLKTGKPAVQSIMTELDLFTDPSLSFMAPGATKGVSIAVVNALSEYLIVEVRRDGDICRQEYRHGVPRTDLVKIGQTSETGTSITFIPEREMFARRFDHKLIAEKIRILEQSFPGIRFHLGIS